MASFIDLDPNVAVENPEGLRQHKRFLCLVASVSGSKLAFVSGPTTAFTGPNNMQA